MDESYVFNSELRALRRLRATNAPSDAGFLFHEGATALADRLFCLKRNFRTPVLHGNDFQALTFALNDLPISKHIEGEQEVWPLDHASCDLVLSNLQLHWVNDLPGLLVQIRRSLRPDGFFSACLIGGESLFELKASLVEAETKLGLPHRPRVSPMIDLPTAAGLMQRTGFSLPVVDHELIRLSYSSPLKLLHDLRLMGQTNALRHQPKTIDMREFWPMVCTSYCDLFQREDTGVEATFDLIFLSGWAPSKTQQQPLKPRPASMDFREGLEHIILSG